MVKVMVVSFVYFDRSVPEPEKEKEKDDGKEKRAKSE